MMYRNLRELIYLKSGGKIPKYQLAPGPLPGKFNGQSDGNGKIWNESLKMWILDPNTLEYWKEKGFDESKANVKLALYGAGAVDENGNFTSSNSLNETFDSTFQNIQQVDYAKQLHLNNLLRLDALQGVNALPVLTVGSENVKVSEKDIAKSQLGSLASTAATLMGGALAGYLGGQQGALGFQGMMSGINMLKDGMKGGAGGLIGGAMNMVSGVIDKLFFADKNFSETSLAIDSAVHGISGAVAGIVPWGTLAAGVLESLNMATKAGGNTVQGYDVDIKSSGYSLAMAHMDDSSSRGLFGIDFGNTSERLAKRNRNLKLAMKAATIAEDNMFELEARSNSIENTIMNNQIALAGGLSTNMIAG